MVKLIKAIQKKINGVIASLIFTGTVLLLLGVLIVWTDFMLRLVVGLLVTVIAAMFFYVAYKIWSIKKSIENHLKLK